MRHILIGGLVSAILAVTAVEPAGAETGRAAWLRYAPLTGTAATRATTAPDTVVVAGTEKPVAALLNNAKRIRISAASTRWY